MKLNYFCFNKFKDKYLITNEQGYYYFLSQDDFKNFICCNFSMLDEKTIQELKEAYFIYDEDETVFVEKVSSLYRNNKNYIFGATCLHIFIMTNICNMCCVYCQAQDSEQNNKGIMNFDIAEKAVEIALQSPERILTFEFQGGEPLINFNTIKHIVEYTEIHKNDKEISYTIVTNTLLLTDEMIDFFDQYNFNISTSLDGNIEIHDSNRPQINGDGTFDIVCSNIRRLQEKKIKVGAIQTTTSKSFSNPKAIVDTYKKLGLHYLFIRPLTPLGFAKEHWNEIGYSVDEFLNFYKNILYYILKCNEDGYKIIEGHASIFLKKILGHISDNYMELRSPCGAGIGQLAYYYDGMIYTCDEGRMLSEMGITDFKMGDVESFTYNDLMESRICKVTCQSSILESIPQCCDCVYHPYCGVCPVVNYSMKQNIYSREANGYKCHIYKGILDVIFEYLYEEEKILEIFKTWI